MKRAATLALIAGALPRVVIAIARWQTAWMSSDLNFYELAAFEMLTVLWIVYLARQASGKRAAANGLAFVMMLLAAVECVGGLAATASVVSALTQGVLVSAWWKAAAALLYGVAQVWYLRDAARSSMPPEAHWNRL